MEIGIVGKPNAGKSTFFSALTLVNAKIQNFPFTTIEPNVGVAYYKTKCAHLELGKPCNPKDSICREGHRFIPIKIIDVAGLVPDAHKGKGLGLKFLDDLSKCDVLVHIIDASGKTNLEGNFEESDPEKEILFLRNELKYWIFGIFKRHFNKIKSKPEFIYEIGKNLKFKKLDIDKSIEEAELNKNLRWNEEELLKFCEKLINKKPILLVGNKIDISDKYIEKLKKYNVIFTSAYYEKLLKMADKAGVIKYISGESDFEIINANEEQKKALEKAKDFLKKYKTTGVQKVINYIVEDLLNLIEVYPVENENKWSDSKGNILPNVFLIPSNSSPLDLAYHIHTDIGKHFLYAIDAKKKIRLGKEAKLKKGDVIKIVHTSK